MFTGLEDVEWLGDEGRYHPARRTRHERLPEGQLGVFLVIAVAAARTGVRVRVKQTGQDRPRFDDPPSDPLEDDPISARERDVP